MAVDGGLASCFLPARYTRSPPNNTETAGVTHPLASTTYCSLTSAYGFPISYMLYVDAFGFARGGIGGSLAIDATCGIVASVLLGGMLLWLTRSGVPVPKLEGGVQTWPAEVLVVDAVERPAEH